MQKKILLTLAEAAKRRDQKFIAGSKKQHAKVMTLLRDEHAGRVAIRFHAVSNKLKLRSGMLGYLPSAGSATKLLESTATIIKRFGFRNLSWRKSQRGSGKVLKNVRRTIRKTCRVFGCDAAANEVACARLQKEPPVALALGPALTPRLVGIVRDKAHSAVRFMKRPFAACPYLERVVRDFARARHSPARMIQCSVDLRRMLEELLAAPIGGQPGVLVLVLAIVLVLTLVLVLVLVLVLRT